MTVSVIKQSMQAVTYSVQSPDNLSFISTVVYASNIKEEITGLWNELVEMYYDLNLENSCWLVGGDLNQIVHFAEHSSSAWDHLTPYMIELRDVFTTLGLEDLRYYGPAHTWTNKRPEDLISKKRDRALVNDKWVSSLPYGVAIFMASKFSDHAPCLVKWSCPLPFSASKP